jgi:hypothetical protein
MCNMLSSRRLCKNLMIEVHKMINLKYISCSNTYCTVMAVLVGITDYATQYFTLFIADYTVGTTIALLTNGSLTSCVDHSHFPSTPLTVDYFRWRRLFTVDSLGSRWLTLQTNCLRRRRPSAGSLRRLSRLANCVFDDNYYDGSSHCRDPT